jgi:Zn-dependent protease
VSILVHELGHALAARAHGWEPYITLHGMGGLASYQPTRRNPMSQILILLAGPGAGFLLAGLVTAILVATHNRVTFHSGGSMLFYWRLEVANPELRIWGFVYDMLFINIWWGLVNLLPVYPLDGGQITRELFNLSRAADGVRTSIQISMFTAGAVAVYALVKLNSGFMAFFFGYLAFLSYQMLQAYTGRGGYGGRW